MPNYLVFTQELFNDGSWEYPEPSYRVMSVIAAKSRGQARATFCRDEYFDHFFTPLHIFQLPTCDVCGNEGYLLPDNPEEQPVACPTCEGRSAFPGGNTRAPYELVNCDKTTIRKVLKHGWHY